MTIIFPVASVTVKIILTRVSEMSYSLDKNTWVSMISVPFMLSKQIVDSEHSKGGQQTYVIWTLWSSLGSSQVNMTMMGHINKCKDMSLLLPPS